MDYLIKALNKELDLSFIFYYFYYIFVVTMRAKIAFICLVLGTFFSGLGFYYGLIYIPLSLFTNIGEAIAIAFSLSISFIIVMINFTSIYSFIGRVIYRLFPYRFH